MISMRKQVYLAVTAIGIFIFILGIHCFRLESAAASEDETVIHMTLLKGLGNMQDWPLVLEKINEITEEKINVQVEISFIDESDSSTEIDARIFNDEPLDLILVNNFQDYCRRGYLLELSELIEEYGEDIKNIIPAEELNYGVWEDGLYGICRNAELAASYGICMRKDILEQYQIDPQGIKTLEDFEKVLEKLKKEGCENIKVAPLAYPYFDSLGDGFGVLMDNREPHTVVNYYETDEFRTFIEKLYQWRQEGYLFDRGYTYDNSRDLLYSHFMNDQLFAYFIKYKPGIDIQEKNLTGYEVVTVNLTESVITTEMSTLGLWCIYSESAHPEEAMKLLNLLYTDEDLANLFCWGIEGTHYVVNGDGTITYPENTTAQTVGYNYNRNWQFPNQYLAYIWENDSPDLESEVKAYNHSAIQSAANGFVFDHGKVEAEYEDVGDIVNAYMRGFLKGELEIEKALPRFLEDLEEAGISEIIEEKQRQLDLWMAEK